MKLMQAAVSFTPNGREPIDAGQVVEVEVDEWAAEIEAGFLVPIVEVAGRDWQSHGSDDLPADAVRPSLTGDATDKPETNADLGRGKRGRPAADADVVTGGDGTE